MKTHPLSAKGKYYVDPESCLWCTMCLIEAPKNFKMPEDYHEGAFVFKQPETSEEEEQCESAMLCCPHVAIFDDGNVKNYLELIRVHLRKFAAKFSLFFVNSRVCSWQKNNE